MNVSYATACSSYWHDDGYRSGRDKSELPLQTCFVRALLPGGRVSAPMWLTDVPRLLSEGNCAENSVEAYSFFLPSLRYMGASGWVVNVVCLDGHLRSAFTRLVDARSQMFYNERTAVQLVERFRHARLSQLHHRILK